MKGFLFFCAAILLWFMVPNQVSGQVTYTSNGQGGWTRSVTPGCENVPLAPNFTNLTGTATCPVTLVIIHTVVLNNLTLGGYVEVVVNSSGTLNITGDLTKSAGNSAKITVDGGAINIGGQLYIASGSQSLKNNLKINIINQGSFHIWGEDEGLKIRNDVVLDIEGDGSEGNELRIKSMSLGQRSTININEGGGLINTGLTDYSGNFTEINVRGFFSTGRLLIRGGKDNKLNTYGNANVIIEGDLDVRGSSEITFGGNSQVDIGGKIRVEGGSKVIATENSKVYVCGEFPDPYATSSGTQQLIDGEFLTSCRILPVDLISFTVHLQKEPRMVTIKWSTAKEWENSHFEVERSLNGGQTFDKIGEVAGMGWTDEVSTYSFSDGKLPIHGGQIYYRLKQVDYSGAFKYSNLISVRLPTVHFTKGIWRAYPNPVADLNFRLQLLDTGQYESGEISILIMSATGNSVQLTATSIFEVDQLASAFMAGAAEGLWVFQLSWGNKVERLKVLKK